MAGYSINFNDTDHTVLTLGRNSDVVINEEVYDQEPSEDFAAATSEVEDIQKALEQGEFDPTTELEATAAGPSSAGAGMPALVTEALVIPIRFNRRFCHTGKRR